MADPQGPLVFAHLQKTAGQTMREILRQRFGTNQVDLQMPPEELTEKRFRFIHRFYPKAECFSGHAFMPWTPVGDLPGVRFFTFVREPVSRTISAYQYLTETGKNPGPYLEWVESERNRQVSRLCGKQDLDAALEVLQNRIGFVGLTEHFDESLVMWHRWANDPKIEIRYKRINVSSNKALKEEIQSSDECMEKTREITDLDQQLYQRVKSEIYPAQKLEYGEHLAADLDAFRASLVEFEPETANSKVGRFKRNVLFRPVWNLYRKWTA